MAIEENLQEEEIELIDESQEEGEWTPAEEQEIEEDVLDEEEEETLKPKKNKTKSYIEKLKAENKKLKAAQKGKEEGEEKNPSIDKVDLLEFRLNNPDASKHIEDIKELVQENPNLGLERAYALVRSEKGESVSNQTFSINNKKVIKKKISELSQDEAIKMFKGNPEMYVKWRKTQKF